MNLSEICLPAEKGIDNELSKVTSDDRREAYTLHKNVSFMTHDFIELGKAKDPPSLYKKFPEVSKLLSERRYSDEDKFRFVY